MKNRMKCVFKGISATFFLIIIFFTCGCQQTPGRTAVVYGGGLEEKLKGSPAPFGAYDAPESWQETLNLKGSDTKIEMNASIIVPDVTAFPVYKVKQTKFDVQRTKSLVDYFAKGKSVIRYAEPTKAELEEQLIQAKANLEKKKANPLSSDNSIKDFEETISLIEAQIPDAPESVEAEVITDWNPDDSPAGTFLTDDGEKAGIWAIPDTFYYMKGFVITEKILIMNDKNAVGDIMISEEDAIAAAQELLHDLGINYMTAGSMEKAERYSSIENAFAEHGEESLSKGYLIKFVRNVNGIAGIADHNVFVYHKEEMDYKAPLYPEEMQIYVDEVGKLQSFVWLHPLVIEEAVNQNASLLPFEAVKQRIRDMLTYINSYNSESVEVANIKMNMTIIDVKDHPGEAMYVPAWFIYYTQTFNDPETGENVKQEYTLVLNAVDGGRVLELPFDNSPEMQQAIDEQRGDNTN